MNTATAVTVDTYSRDWLDENDYALTDKLFRSFNLLNERDWDLAESVGVAVSGDEIVGVIIGYDEICIICQVAWDKQRQGIGRALVQSTGMYAPKQNGAPEFWDAMQDA
jgi:GNAT superfamily N-acetyltransferase